MNQLQFFSDMKSELKDAPKEIKESYNALIQYFDSSKLSDINVKTYEQRYAKGNPKFEYLCDTYKGISMAVYAKFDDVRVFLDNSSNFKNGVWSVVPKNLDVDNLIKDYELDKYNSYLSVKDWNGAYNFMIVDNMKWQFTDILQDFLNSCNLPNQKNKAFTYKLLGEDLVYLGVTQKEGFFLSDKLLDKIRLIYLDSAKQYLYK